jgi:ribulose kinase
MSLLASVCGVKVIIPPQPSAAVVVGAAMLGRFAAEVSERRQRKPIESQSEAEEVSYGMKEKLWEIMV